MIIRRYVLAGKQKAKHRLPAVYPYHFFVTGGGLISYGADYVDQYRRPAACSYLLGACTGKSPGFSPLRMRSTP